MPLTKLGKAYLEYDGNAQDRLQTVLNWAVRSNNAAKYNTGIYKFLQTEQESVEEGGERTIEEMEETITKADGSVTTKRMLILSEEDSKNPQRLMELMGFDPLQWKLEWCKTRRNYWDTTMKLGGNGSFYPHKETNHAFVVEIRVSPIQGILTSDMVANVFNTFEAPELITYVHKQTSGNLLELPIMDVHLGKLAWADEAGEDYDLKISEALFKDTVSEILHRVEEYGLSVDEIVFPIGQDFFHFDSTGSTTTKGTLMDTDTRWQKMYSKGIELSVWAIENLRVIAPVRVPYVASNHDKMLSYCLTNHINAHFRSAEDVTVSISPYPRQYIRWGKCLIGYSHGSEEGKRIEKLMQDESPDWSDTVFREFHLGHLHSEQVREDVGLIIRNVASITSRDNWHTEHGFKSTRKAQAFLWNKEKGKLLTIDVNVGV